MAGATVAATVAAAIESRKFQRGTQYLAAAIGTCFHIVLCHVVHVALSSRTLVVRLARDRGMSNDCRGGFDRSKQTTRIIDVRNACVTYMSGS